MNMAGNKDKSGKRDNCWSCGTRLDQPFHGAMPQPHGCGKTDCVRCPKCGAGICEYDEAEKAEKAERIKAMGKGSAKGKAKGAKGASPGGPGGCPGSPPISPRENLPAVDPFPLDVFPAKLQQYASEAAAAFSCPPDYPAMAMIAVAGAAIGNSRVLEIRRTFQASASLYVCIIGEPGVTKTPLLLFVLRPVHKRSEELAEEHGRAMAKHIRAKQENTKANRKSEGRVATDEALKPPIEQRIDTTDSTVEAVADLLAKNFRGLLLFREELAGWALSMNLYRKGKGTDRQFYMSVYSNARYTVDRKSHEAGPLRLARPFLCVLGAATPDMLSVFQDEEGREDGFLDRLMAVFPDGNRYNPWSDADVELGTESIWDEVVGKLYSLQPETQGRRKFPCAVGLTDGAKEEWVRLFNGMANDIAEECFPTNLIGSWRKLQTYAARLTLVLHELRWACGEARTQEMVDAETVRAASRLISYLQTHTVRVKAAMAAAVQLDEADSAFAVAVAKVVTAAGGFWRGTAEQLTEATAPQAIQNPHWPGNPRSVGRAVRRLAKHLLRAHQVQFTPPRSTDKTRVMAFTVIKQMPKTPETPSDGASACQNTTSVSGVSPGVETPNARNAHDARPNQADADSARAFRASAGETPKETPETETPETKRDAAGPGVSGVSGVDSEGTSASPDGREEGDA
jgi:hypothetical protein